MPSQALYEELDRSIDVMIADPDANLSSIDPELAGLMSLAADLRHLPRLEFRSDLRTALVGQVFLSATPIAGPIATRSTEQLLPTLFGGGSGTYRMRRTNFLASALIHTAAIALIATSGFWLAEHHRQVNKQQMVELTEPDLSELYTVSKTTTAGGGGGGDRDKVVAPKGQLPKQSFEQVTPPAMVIRNETPKLTVAPTIVAPPINMANMPNLGDPYSHTVNLASNGTGSGGGLGTGSGGGVGSGKGPGVGPGFGGGMGGGVYRVGGGVSAPRVLYQPDPSYSEEARKAKFQGTVVLWTVIGADGRVHDTKVARSLGMGLDQQAIEAVRQWRFEPAMKDGQPVAVQINVEVNFRLY